MDYKELVKNLEASDYEIRENGHLWSKKSNQYITEKPTGKRLMCRAEISLEGKRKIEHFRIDYLIAAKFITKAVSDKYLHYDDGNYFNCTSSNLYWSPTKQRTFSEPIINPVPVLAQVEPPKIEPKPDHMENFNYDECLKIIPQIEALGYVINKDGTIYDSNAKEFVEQRDLNGYKVSYLSKLTMVTVHRIVALKYIPNPDKKPYVNHIDENPINNVLSNLEWCTQQENCAAHSKDTSHPVAIIQYDKKGNKIAEFTSITEAGKKMGVDRTTISRALTGKNKSAGGFIWKYADDKNNNNKVINISEAKLIDEHPKYYIFSDGRVYSKKTNKILKNCFNSDDRPYVTLTNKKNVYIKTLLDKYYPRP